jgi:hypothetical protein
MSSSERRLNITFVKTPDANRDRRLFWAAAHRSVRTLWAGAILIVVVGVGIAVAGFTLDLGAVGPIGAVVAAFGAWIFFVPQILRRGASRRTSIQAAASVTIHLTDSAAIFETPLSQAHFKWPMVSRVEDRHGFWIAYGERRVLFALPQECMAADQIAEFRAFLAARTPPRAPQRT